MPTLISSTSEWLNKRERGGYFGLHVYIQSRSQATYRDNEDSVFRTLIGEISDASQDHQE